MDFTLFLTLKFKLKGNTFKRTRLYHKHNPNASGAPLEFTQIVEYVFGEGEKSRHIPQRYARKRSSRVTSDCAYFKRRSFSAFRPIIAIPLSSF